MDKINVIVNNDTLVVDKFSSVREVVSLVGLQDKDIKLDYFDNPIVGAVVNGESSSLEYALRSDSTLEPIYVFETLGRRIYRHSICFLLSYAASLVIPERNLVIGHSLGDGFYFSFSDDNFVSEEIIKKLEEKMREVVESSFPIHFSSLAGNEAIAHFRNKKKDKTALLLSSRNDPVVNVYSLNDYAQVSYEPLVSNTSLLTLWELRPYGGKGMLLRYPVSTSIKEIQKLRDNPLLFKVFEEYKGWGKVLGVRSVGEMNRLIVKGGGREYVKLSEDLHRRKIASIADSVSQKGAKIVFVAGPSSSGKTTFAKRLCEELKLLGFEPFKLSLDDYYNPPQMAPLDDNGKPDLEALEALNIDLIDSNMEALVEGKSVNLPSYDFNTHLTTFSPVPVKMGDRTIMVVEGIHALNERITSSVDSRFIYKVYISALTHLNLDDSNRVSTADNRLLRRLVRDHRSRGMSAERTLGMWPSVTRGESLHIFPHQNNADVMFNSALDYEIGVLYPFVVPLLRAVERDEGEVYTRARRLLAFLENVYPIPSNYVPSDSLLREFIGESDYE